MEKNYRINPAWKLFVEEDKLFITSGGDEIFLVDEATPQQARAIGLACEQRDFSALSAIPGCADILAALEGAGALFSARAGADTPGRDVFESLKIHCLWQGKPQAPLPELLARFITARPGLRLVESREEADILLVIRCSGSIELLPDAYQSLETPHLLADLAYNHTISLGPLVIPGHSACLNCFAGRLVRHWGNPPTPEEPQAGKHYELIAAFILEQLLTFKKFGNCPSLINRVIAFNLNDFSSQGEKVHRLPWCPFCFPPEKLEGSGSFELPWRF